MKILHIIRTLDPATGGPAMSVRSLIQYQEVGYNGEAVTLDDPEAPFLRDLPFPVTALGPVGSNYGFSLRLLKWLFANSINFDGVIVNGLWNYCGLAALIAVRGRVPYMVFPHGMLDPYFKKKFPLKHLKKWIYWVVADYWVLKLAFRVLFTSRQEARLAPQSFWLHRWVEQVVPYGSSEPPLRTERMDAALHERCPEVRGKCYLLFLGRIHHKKGCDLLIRSFIRSAGLDPYLSLVMAGPDEEGWSRVLKLEVEAAGLAHRVVWPGMLVDDAKWGAFYNCDAFVLPSHQENFGIAVAEALSCGRPVLLSDQVNIAEEIQTAGAGLMEPDTQEGTNRLLQRWLQLPQEEKAAMESRAKSTYATKFDMKQSARMIVDLLKKAT